MVITELYLRHEPGIPADTPSVSGHPCPFLSSAIITYLSIGTVPNTYWKSLLEDSRKVSCPSHPPTDFCLPSVSTL